MFTILLLSIVGCGSDVPSVSLAWHVERIDCFENDNGQWVASWGAPTDPPVLVSALTNIPDNNVVVQVASSNGRIGIGEPVEFRCDYPDASGEGTVDGDVVIVTWASE